MVVTTRRRVLVELMRRGAGRGWALGGAVKSAGCSTGLAQGVEANREALEAGESVREREREGDEAVPAPRCARTNLAKFNDAAADSEARPSLPGLSKPSSPELSSMSQS